MNSIQAVICVIAVCAVTACGVIGYEYAVNDADGVIQDDGDNPTTGEEERNIMATDGLWTYTVDGSNATLTKYGGSFFSGTLTVPSTVSDGTNTYTVVATKGTSTTSVLPRYNQMGPIYELVLPDTLTEIGEYSFKNCLFSECTLTIPSTVTRIGQGAFQNGAGLAGPLTIPDSVTTIGSNAFSGTTFNGPLIIGKSVTGIGDSAFRNCNGLTSVTLGNSVQIIDNYAFYGCTALHAVYVQTKYAALLNIQKGSISNGYVAYYADTLVQGSATLTLNRASTDPTDQWTPQTITVKPGESASLPDNYPSFTTQVPGTNKITTITHTATGWTEQ